MDGFSQGEEAHLEEQSSEGEEQEKPTENRYERDHRESSTWWRRGSTKPVDQGFLQGARGGLGAAGEVEAPAQHFSGAAIKHGNERAPPVLAALDEGDICAPALIGRRSDGP